MSENNQPEQQSNPDHPIEKPQPDLVASASTFRRVSKRAVVILVGVTVTAALSWGIVNGSGVASFVGERVVGAPLRSTNRTPDVVPLPADPGQGRQLDRYRVTSDGTTSATKAQQRGVVEIYTVLTDGSKAAGTGIVLTHGGEILTNNHVVEASVKIRVVVVATDVSYSARVVGTDASDDVAVLQIRHAPRLSTAVLDPDDEVNIGDRVTGVGNAGGVGGVPSAASGRVRAVDASITVRSETSSEVEHLSGLIKVAANIQAGDSGGPLYNADNEVIGLNTAASRGRVPVVGFAVPISTALAVADKIESGVESQKITLGYPAFLGVQLQADAGYEAARGTRGASIAAVVPGSAAAAAGLSAGDTVTAIDQAPVSSTRDLSRVIASYSPGDSVTVTWSSPGSGAHTRTVTLHRGPAA